MEYFRFFPQPSDSSTRTLFGIILIIYLPL